MDLSHLKTELYDEQRTGWPKIGRHILAHYDATSIVVYQAFCPDIADYAVKNGAFGGPRYSFSRMTWIKTNFLWMMYRSGWATKKNQERILAIFLKREGFEEILRCAKEVKQGPRSAKKKNCQTESTTERVPGGVRMQWDPDHYPDGEKARRRAVQLGISGKILARFHDEWLLRIEDITDFVVQQRYLLKNSGADKLRTPRERTYVPRSPQVSRHVGLDTTEPNEVEIRDTIGSNEIEARDMKRTKEVGIRGVTGPDEVKNRDSTIQHEMEIGGATGPNGVEMRIMTGLATTKTRRDDVATADEARQAEETDGVACGDDWSNHVSVEGACCTELLRCQISDDLDLNTKYQDQNCDAKDDVT